MWTVNTLSPVAVLVSLARRLSPSGAAARAGHQDYLDCSALGRGRTDRRADLSRSAAYAHLDEEEFQIAEEVGNQVAIALRVWRLIRPLRRGFRLRPARVAPLHPLPAPLLRRALPRSTLSLSLSLRPSHQID